MKGKDRKGANMGKTKKNESATPILEEFELYLRNQNKAENTIHVYLYAVEQFLTLYKEMDYDHLQLYKCYLLERYKPQTVNLRIRALNCYMEFLDSGQTRLVMIRTQQKPFLENVISQADYEYLKNCLLRDGNLLYYYVIRFMAATGVRVSELVQFRVEHVKKGQMDIYSKDNKIRRVYIPRSLKTDAELWIKRAGRTKGFLFLNRYGDPITPAGIRGQLRKFAYLYNLSPEVLHPHSFRHRFAKNFIEKCSDISFLSDLLGHENVETTRIYLQRSSSEQQQIVNRIINW